MNPDGAAIGQAIDDQKKTYHPYIGTKMQDEAIFSLHFSFFNTFYYIDCNRDSEKKKPNMAV